MNREDAKNAKEEKEINCKGKFIKIFFLSLRPFLSSLTVFSYFAFFAPSR
jgi:hypothetical protein